MTFSGQLRSAWLWPIAAAWALLVATEVTGLSAAGDHHALIEGDRWPWGVSLTFFTLFWLVMVAAMMLPVNLPMLDALRRGAGGVSPTTAAFLAGYSGVWAAFGAAVFVGDTGVHSLTHSWHWLHENGWAVLAATLAVVGLFQSAPAKRRYLEECRHRTNCITRHAGGGWVGALAQGLRYGRCELLCCWALMLLVVAVGHGLIWTLAFTGVMFAERTLPRGELLARLTGAAVTVLSGAVVVVNVS